MPDYSDGELEKNDHPNNGSRNPEEDDPSGGVPGSDDEDVFIQAAAIAGERQADAQQGKYQVVDEGGPVSVSW